jgi:transcriptional regulator with XRE-family HTH domain
MSYQTAHEWEVFIGEQLRAARQRKNMKQEELAGRAGVSLPTVSRLETGKGSSLTTLIKVLQVLKEEAWLERLAPKVSISPIQLHKLGKPRQRVR